jgi:hypothetical protein
MTDRRYWVIGGEFVDGAFDKMDGKTARVLGPFSALQEAEAVWRNVSRQHGHEFTTRFTVVHEPMKPATA